MDKNKEEQEKFLRRLGLIRTRDVTKTKLEIDLGREKAMRSAKEFSRRKRARTLEKIEGEPITKQVEKKSKGKSNSKAPT